MRVSVMQSDGTRPLEDFDLSVPARGLAKYDLCSKLGSNSYGVITALANKSKRVTGLLVRHGENDRYLMATAMR